MTTARRQSSPPARQVGFTLVELLVGIAVGLLILAGIDRIFMASKASYNAQTSIGRIQETGRYAVNVIAQDLRRAGYWGLMNMRVAKTDEDYILEDEEARDRCPPNNQDWGKMITQRIYGLNDTRGDYRCINNYRTGDILTVRYASPTPRTVYDLSGPDYKDNNRLFVRAQAFSGTVSSGPPPTPSPSPAPPPYTEHEVVAHAYYIGTSRANDRDRDCRDHSIPALFRKFLDKNGEPRREELISGVENLQVRYGFDTDGDGSANQYKNADQIALDDWDNVVSARFWLLVRDECPETGYTDDNTYVLGDLPALTPGDNFRRQLYSMTVALRNGM